MTTTHLKTPLSGVQLESFLDQLYAQIEQQEQAEVDEAIIHQNIFDQLSQHSFEPNSRAQIRNLYLAWLKINQIDNALYVIVDLGPKALLQVPKEEQEEMQVALNFWHYEVLLTKDRDESLMAKLKDLRLTIEEYLRQISEPHLWGTAWSHLKDYAQYAEDFAQVKRIIETEYQILLNQTDRDSYRAWDAALHYLKLARVEDSLGQKHLVLENAQKAYTSLAKKAPDQDVNQNDWFKLAELMVSFCPDLMGKVLEQIRTLQEPNLPLSRLKQYNIWIARIVAKAYYAQGRLADAIEKAVDGRYTTDRDKDDDWTALLLDWLIEDNQLAKAAELAFESLLFERSTSAQKAFELAQKYAPNSANNQPTEAPLFWLACLAIAPYSSPVQEFFEGKDDDQWVTDYLAIADQIQPQHIATDIVKAKVLVYQGNITKAHPLFEQIVLHPQYSGPDEIGQLMQCRVFVYGLEKALSMELPKCDCGAWCYSIALGVDDYINALVEDGYPKLSEDQAEAIAHFYYAQGVANFERFFESDTGFFKDGEIHTYSMMCNNLAIDFSNRLNQYPQAIALHEKGIQTSPFAEHYDGILRCFSYTTEAESYIQAADNLWNYASTYGYGRHSPTHYISNVAHALNELDRDAEIAIWIERLDEWWAELDTEDQAEKQDRYVIALVNSLTHLAATQKEDALLRFNRIKHQLPESASSYFWCNVADFYRELEDFANAKMYYEFVLANFDASDTNCSYCQTQLQKLNPQATPTTSSIGKKAWWKFWA